MAIVFETNKGKIYETKPSADTIYNVSTGTIDEFGFRDLGVALSYLNDPKTTRVNYEGKEYKLVSEISSHIIYGNYVARADAICIDDKPDEKGKQQLYRIVWELQDGDNGQTYFDLDIPFMVDELFVGER